MAIEVVTKEDLQVFRVQLLKDIKILLDTQPKARPNMVGEEYRTRDVRRILGCSVNKLVSLRVARKIRWKKIGGTIYYNKEDIRRLVEDGF
jgi:hypothetical protein